MNTSTLWGAKLAIRVNGAVEFIVIVSSVPTMFPTTASLAINVDAVLKLSIMLFTVSKQSAQSMFSELKLME